MFQETDEASNQTACRILEQYDWTFYQVSFFLTSYVLPLMLICIFYMSMLIKLWRSVRDSAESRRGRRRVTRLVFVIVGVFAACWCPIQVKGPVSREGGGTIFLFCFACFFRTLSSTMSSTRRRVAGDTGDQVPGCVSVHHGDGNGADSQPYPRLHQQLHQPFPLRLPERCLPRSLPKDYLLQATDGFDEQSAGTIDENHESCQYWRYSLGEKQRYFFAIAAPML